VLYKRIQKRKSLAVLGSGIAGQGMFSEWVTTDLEVKEQLSRRQKGSEAFR
jgi:hypothetical protein